MPRRKDIYMIIGIMGAMPDEVDQLCAKLENVTVEPYGGVEYHRGTLAGKQVVVCCAGMGKANAAATTQVLITRYGAEKIIFSGIAGNMTSKIGIGDVVIGKTVLYHDAQLDMICQNPPYLKEYAGDPALIAAAEKACAEAGVKALTGKIATGDLFVGDSETDAEIYAVLEREIIDLTLRPGSSLSENPLCARFGAPRSMIRVVLQRLQENGLVKIVPYKVTTVTRLNREIVDELIYERTAVEARVLRDFSPRCTPEQRALIRRRTDAYAALARAEEIDYNKLYEADRLLHETWFAAMGKMYLWRTLQNAHADYSRFRMLDTMTSGGLDEVIADHQNIITAIERCDLAAFEPLVERHLYGGIRRLGSKLTEEYADYFEPEK